MKSTIWRAANSINSRFLGYDRRVRFRDLANIPPEQRRASTRVINFYSAVNNIGNYLPLLGIRAMLHCDPDTWNIHNRSLDFDFINQNYDAVIIGGAGLLDKGFEPFWDKFARECTLPTAIWGVGICAPDSAAVVGVDRGIIAQAVDKCQLVNVRDNLTAEHYRLRNAEITPCPTLAYLDDYFGQRSPRRHTVLYSSHEELVEKSERERIRAELERLVGPVRFTDNIQRPLRGLDDIIRFAYGRSRLVVTTRLHGAIIAYGLGIPYIALARDDKIRAFNRMCGNGVLVERAEELPTLLTARIDCKQRVQLHEVHEFGDKARRWLSSI